MINYTHQNRSSECACDDECMVTVTSLMNPCKYWLNQCTLMAQVGFGTLYKFRVRVAFFITVCLKLAKHPTEAAVSELWSSSFDLFVVSLQSLFLVSV